MWLQCKLKVSHCLQLADDADNYLPVSDEDKGDDYIEGNNEQQQPVESLFPAKGKPPYFSSKTRGTGIDDVPSPGASSVTSREVETKI